MDTSTSFPDLNSTGSANYVGLFRRDSSCQTHTKDLSEFKSILAELSSFESKLDSTKHFIKADYEAKLEKKVKEMGNSFMHKYSSIEADFRDSIARIRNAYKTKLINSIGIIDNQYQKVVNEIPLVTLEEFSRNEDQLQELTMLRKENRNLREKLTFLGEGINISEQKKDQASPLVERLKKELKEQSDDMKNLRLKSVAEAKANLSNLSKTAESLVRDLESFNPLDNSHIQNHNSTKELDKVKSAANINDQQQFKARESSALRTNSPSFETINTSVSFEAETEGIPASWNKAIQNMKTKYDTKIESYKTTMNAMKDKIAYLKSQKSDLKKKLALIENSNRELSNQVKLSIESYEEKLKLMDDNMQNAYITITREHEKEMMELMNINELLRNSLVKSQVPEFISEIILRQSRVAQLSYLVNPAISVLSKNDAETQTNWREIDSLRLQQEEVIEDTEDEPNELTKQLNSYRMTQEPEEPDTKDDSKESLQLSVNESTGSDLDFLE